jgi:hypothetical protein
MTINEAVPLPGKVALSPLHHDLKTVDLSLPDNLEENLLDERAEWKKYRSSRRIPRGHYQVATNQLSGPLSIPSAQPLPG